MMQAFTACTVCATLECERNARLAPIAPHLSLPSSLHATQDTLSSCTRHTHYICLSVRRVLSMVGPGIESLQNFSAGRMQAP